METWRFDIEYKQRICKFADFYLSNELRLSWKDKQDIFIWMIPHVWACHVPLQPQLYLMVIVCLPMEIVSFSCVDNVQQLLFTSDHLVRSKKKKKSKMF